MPTAADPKPAADKPADPAPAAPTAPDVSKIPPDLLALVADPDRFKARLGEAQTAGQRALAKSLGFADVEAMTKALEAARKLEDAQKTDLQRLTDQVAALSPQAARATALEAAIAETLKAQEGAIPEASRGLLDLAPTDPADRLRWIATAQAKGLFAPASAAAAPAAAKATATTRAGGSAAAAPAAAKTQGGKLPSDMTESEFTAHKSQWLAQLGGRLASGNGS